MSRRTLVLASAGAAALLGCAFAPLPAFAASAGPEVAFVGLTDRAVVSGTTIVRVDLDDDDLASYNLRVDSTGLDYAYRAADGVRAFAWNTVGLTDGAHTLLATATDADGHKTTTKLTVLVDNVAPVLSSSIAEGAFVRGTADIVLTVDEATPQAYHAQLYTAAGVAVPSVQGYQWEPKTGELVLPAVDFRKLADGAYVLRLSAKSEAGLSGSLAVHFTVDDTRPALSIDAPAVGSAVKPGTAVRVALTAEDAVGLQRVAANLYDAANAKLVASLGATSAATPLQSTGWTGGFALPTNLAEGVYTIRASVTDRAGNSATVTRALRVDATRPELTVTTSPAEDGGTEVVLSASDAGLLNRLVANLYDAANSTLLGTVGSTSATTPLGTTDSTVTFVVPADRAAGDYTIRAGATDVAGNNRTVSVPLTIAAPAVSADPAPADQTGSEQTPAETPAGQSGDEAPAELSGDQAPGDEQPAVDGADDTTNDDGTGAVAGAPAEVVAADEPAEQSPAAAPTDDAAAPVADPAARPVPASAAAAVAVDSSARLASTGVDAGTGVIAALVALVLGAAGAVVGLRRKRTAA